MIQDPHEAFAEELTDTDAASSASRSRRARVALALILIILVALLCGVVAFVVRLATPVGAPDSADVPDGLTWVRSIYGWGKTESQQLYGPSDVAIGPDGTIWVADSQRFQVVGFTPEGKFKGLINQGASGVFPQALDASEDNEIYVADFANDRIVVFSPDNEVLREWEIPQPMEVDVEGDRVVVTSRAGAALFDTNGEIINVWGSRGSGEDQFDVVRGAAIGPDGTIYLSDTQNHRLKAYDEAGTLKWVYPTAKDFAAFEADKTLKKPYQIPAGMTFDAAGRLLLTDPFEFSIIHVDTETGKTIETWGEFGEDDGKFAYPTSIAYDPARDWYAVADTANDRVQIVRIEGSGGGVVAAARRFSSGPVWVCAIPLVLLLLAAIIGVVSRRRSRAARDDSNGVSEEVDGVRSSDGNPVEEI